MGRMEARLEPDRLLLPCGGGGGSIGCLFDL